MTSRVWFYKPTSTTWTHVKIYRSTSYSGSYSNIATQALTTDAEQYYDDADGTSSHFYKVGFWDGANESSLSDPVRGGDVAYYTNLSRIKGYLQLPTDFSSSTKPTANEVVDLMQEADADIDTRTGHAWRMRFSYDVDDTDDYEFHDIKGFKEYNTGIPIYLDHRKIKALDADMGDVLEVWNGSSWEDWLTARTEGRGGDFWFDYSQGILFIRTSVSFRPLKKGIRMRYRYGSETVPYDIRKLATIMVAIELYQSDDYSAMFPEGGDGLTIQEKIRIDRDKVEAMMAKFTEFKTMD